jgi:hypothetical protein
LVIYWYPCFNLPERYSYGLQHFFTNTVLQAQTLLLPQLAPSDFLLLLTGEPWLLEPGALQGSLVGLADLMPGREPAAVLLHHVKSSSSQLLQEFKRQALAQVGLR